MICSVVDVNVKDGTVAIRNPKAPTAEASRIFTFDSVYDPKSVHMSHDQHMTVTRFSSTQLDLYDETVRAMYCLVESHPARLTRWPDGNVLKHLQIARCPDGQFVF